MNFIVYISTSILMILGLLGSFLPFLPGPPLSFAGLLVYAIFDRFESVSVLAVIIFAILTVLTLVFDFFAPILGAKGYKASKWGIIGSLIGAVVGLWFGPVAIFTLPLLGAFVGEYFYVRDSGRALKTAWGSFVGMIFGLFFRTGVTIIMLFYWLYAIFLK
jgi:hypothetical protein